MNDTPLKGWFSTPVNGFVLAMKHWAYATWCNVPIRVICRIIKWLAPNANVFAHCSPPIFVQCLFDIFKVIWLLAYPLEIVRSSSSCCCWNFVEIFHACKHLRFTLKTIPTAFCESQANKIDFLHREKHGTFLFDAREKKATKNNEKNKMKKEKKLDTRKHKHSHTHMHTHKLRKINLIFIHWHAYCISNTNNRIMQWTHKDSGVNRE